MVRTPLSKIQRTPSTTPGGCPRAREENILVTVRMRPLNRKEQAMYDLIAWDCLDQHTLVFKNPNHERPLNPYCFGNLYLLFFLLTFQVIKSNEIWKFIFGLSNIFYTENLIVLFFSLHETDKVFYPTCSTQRVYDEGAKDVALSALTGMNGNDAPLKNI